MGLIKGAALKQTNSFVLLFDPNHSKLGPIKENRKDQNESLDYRFKGTY